MITININHAFDGFLYSPLFLAHELGFFPKCAKLVFRNGDSECLDALCQTNSGSEKNWFAICDPFSVDLSKKNPAHTGDQLCVVGCIVDKLPVWLFNPDPSIDTVHDESQLARLHDNVQKLICYKETTTGYLIAKRLQKIFGLRATDLVPRSFGEEFTGTVANDTVVATSDILHVVRTGLHGNKIIFNYAQQSPAELNPFLFTGILTLKKAVLDDNLWAILTVLAGIKKAVDLLREENVRPEFVTILAKHFEQKLAGMGITSLTEQEELVRASIVYAFSTQDLYSESLKPTKEAWDNARKQWETTMQRRFVDTIDRNEPIPALLIKRGWQRDAELRHHISRGFPDVTTLVEAGFLEQKHIVALVIALFAAVLSSHTAIDAVVNMSAPLSTNIPWITASGISFVFLMGSVVQLFRTLLKGDMKPFTTLVGIGLGALGIFYLFVVFVE